MSNFAVALPCHTFSSLGYYQSCIGPGTSILLNDRGIEVCFPGRLRDLSLLLNVQTGSVSARVPVSCALVEWRRWAGTGRSFQGVKQPEHEAEYSPLSGTELKHRWSLFFLISLSCIQILSRLQCLCDGKRHFSDAENLQIFHPAKTTKQWISFEELRTFISTYMHTYSHGTGTA